ncbi:MAG: hypothetical protein RO009_19505 [Pseudorhodoplanes sp.]|jgi:hypothetical protein|nr:hypothetical protein [Pseudorhodoplanes sp.]
MIRIVHSPAIWAVAASLVFGGIAPVFGQDIAAPEKRTASVASSQKRNAVSSQSHVYLLRGLLNIFSLGMDDLAQKLEARGIRTSVHNHSEWESLSDQIAAKYKAGNRGAIILVGHSLGADAVMFMGEYLGKKGVPVALIVPFDGTGSFAASSNVQRVMNLTQRDYAYMKRGHGFRGELANIDVSGQGYGHTDIDKSARLHSMVINKIVGIVGRGGGTRTAAPDAPKPRPAAAPASAPSTAPTAAPAAAPSGNSGSAESSSRSASATPASDISSSSPAVTGTTPAQKPDEKVQLRH